MWGSMRCIGFDGAVKWQILSDVRSGDSLSKSGGFDVAADGTLYTLGHRADSVQRFAVADGKPLEPIKLQIDGAIQADPRLSHPGMTSIYRAVNGLAREYGPWLTTLKSHDSVAIVVSGRMMRTDTWGNVMGTYFARLKEAYCSCLHAHHPATIIFADEMTPDALKSFSAVLVVGQRVELEPKLLQALQHAHAARVALFRDGTCREELVPMWNPSRRIANRAAKTGASHWGRTACCSDRACSCRSSRRPRRDSRWSSS